MKMKRWKQCDRPISRASHADTDQAYVENIVSMSGISQRSRYPRGTIVPKGGQQRL